MAPSRTVLVVAALDRLGIEAWTPTEKSVRRVGRLRERQDVFTPMMPTFVFADHARVGELVAMSQSPAQTYQRWDRELRRFVTVGVPMFSVFRYGEGYPRVPDRQLEALRIEERRAQDRVDCATFAPGERVCLADAGFEGLVGVVEASNRRYTRVCFPIFGRATKPVEIRTLLLQSVQVEGSQPEHGIAA